MYMHTRQCTAFNIGTDIYYDCVHVHGCKTIYSVCSILSRRQNLIHSYTKIIHEITGTTSNTLSSSTIHSAVSKTEETFSIGIKRLSTELSYKDLHQI